MKLLENISCVKICGFFTIWNLCKAGLVSSVESTSDFIFNFEVGNQWQRYLSDIECCKRLDISALEMCIRLERVVYSAVKQASFGTGRAIVWTQPEDIHCWLSCGTNSGLVHLLIPKE